MSIRKFELGDRVKKSRSLLMRLVLWGAPWPEGDLRVVGHELGGFIHVLGVHGTYKVHERLLEKSPGVVS